MSRPAAALFFVKLPEPGRVKTRLAAAIGDDRAMRLYDAFARDQRDALLASGLHVIACCDPAASSRRYRTWLGQSVGYMDQRGDDLGQRMANAFADAFADGREAAVLTGSDAPHMPSSLVAEALAQATSVGAAIAPSPDGGYSLIAFKRDAFAPEIFENMQWSTPEVLATTLDSFAHAGRAVHLLPAVDDIDTIEDLEALVQRFANGGGPARTLRLAAQFGIGEQVD
ncbi:hypothetical protein GGQ74_001908 [Desulfobaculum xiamenense]|uniref:Glycosyltransferase n=1 Tax=Desulfobaculum xiamenense TaxID=995050 RepID=A0A846QS29_9BACT|nr:TIGR04282 family arsenosugar biosynthesis glycosyltransferase [Desulfobaculum xiamenense]NJB68235.1 hypothetical protein [Desulfobaculum xiamenense]